MPHPAFATTHQWLDAVAESSSGSCARTELSERARMLALLTSPPSDPTSRDPFSRDHFTPGHFTASAFVISPNLDALLLIFHGKLHRWLQPGGHIEPEDADLVDASRREVSEETGLEAHTLRLVGSTAAPFFDLDIHEIPARKKDPTHFHFDVRMLFVADSENVAAGSDAKDARFVALDAVTLEETDASVMRAVEKIRNAKADGVLADLGRRDPSG